MEKVLLFGTGKIADIVMRGIVELKTNRTFEVIGFLDNFKSKHECWGYPVYSPSEMSKLDYDMIILCVKSEFGKKQIDRQLVYQDGYYSKNIRNQLIYGYGIEANKIKDIYYLLKLIMQEKYYDTKDLEIRTTLDYWEAGNDFSEFNNFDQVTEPVYDEVHWDQNLNLPYIMFSDIQDKLHRMYYPRGYSFDVKDGKQVIRNLGYEQLPASPHLYMQGSHKIHDGDCVADVGVCEGNFALRYIEMISKVYLFECEPSWLEPLWYTFKDYQEKVSFFDKAASDRTTFSSIKLDDAIHDKLNFLKMDIEGAERAALLGAEKVLKENDVQCSVTTYHCHGDEEAVRQILKEYGYKTSVSKGYIVCTMLDDIFYHADFRRGVVYGDRT